MKLLRFMLPVVAALVLAGCSKSAPDVVNDIYSSLQKGDLEKLIQYAIPDSVGELSESEKMLFTNELKGDFSKESNTILSYEILKVDTLGNRADFEVKTVHNGGTTYNEKGTIFHNPETDRWTLRLDSIYTEKDKERTNEAMPRLRAAVVTALSAKGVPYYMFENAMMIEKAIYATKDPVQSFNLYKKAAEAGYAPAYYRLGNAYMNAYGTDKSVDKAFEAYKKGTELNDEDCIFELAECYQYGKGTMKDPAKTFELAKKLYEIDPTSPYLGNCYREGIGTPKDLEKALQCWKKGAELGGSNSAVCIGNAYYRGEGVAEDYKEALIWYNKAIELDSENEYPYQGMGWIYADGGCGVEKNPEEAVRLFKKGAELGSDNCMNSLGICYRDRIGVNKDIDKAREWFQKAADAGNYNAKTNLGNLWRY